MKFGTLQSSDGQLVKAFLKGDNSAFEQLYSWHKNVLYGYLNRMFPQRRDFVDEVFQQSWLRCINNLHKYRDQGNFTGWLLRIARNLALDELKKENRIKYNEQMENDFFEFVDQRQKNPREKISAGETGAIIESALQLLSAEQREVFLLRAEDVAFKEIAEIQRCSINTVLARMRYAAANLKKILEDKL